MRNSKIIVSKDSVSGKRPAASAGKKAATRIVVAVYGADTRIGNKLVAMLKANNLGVLPRPTQWAIGKQSDVIRADVAAKQPAIICNCLIDPDSGDLPIAETSAYVTVTQALVSAAKQQGCRYVHCSSARIYGPGDKPDQGNSYTEYDTVLVKGDDPWRSLVAATERAVMYQTLLANPVAARTSNIDFSFYVLRFGHVISFEESRSQRFPAVHTLSACLLAAKQTSKTFVCDNPDRLISPITSTFAATCVTDVCNAACPAPYGFYNIGSSEPTTLREMCSRVSLRSGVFTSFAASTPRHSDWRVYGVDANQSVNSDWWVSRGMRAVPRWQAAIRDLMRDSDLCAV